jgi:hypothetical protein
LGFGGLEDVDRLRSPPTTQANLNRIDALNAAQTGARYGVNKFADLTPKEFKVPSPSTIPSQPVSL